MSVIVKFAVAVSLIVVSTATGYLARRARFLPERAAEPILTYGNIIGSPIVGMLSVWGLAINPGDYFLIAAGVAQIVIMAFVGLAVGRLATANRSKVGLMGMFAAAGNCGFTMGGFIIYMLYGEYGLGLVGIYTLLWFPAAVVVLYPIARRYSCRSAAMSLPRLVLRSIFDWRSIGVLFILAGIGLSAMGIKRPEAVARFRITDILMFVLTSVSYFAIGLRLHAGYILIARKLILALGAARFLIGPLVGFGLAAMTYLTAWPMDPVSRNVIVIQACVPAAITVVAIANMFRIQARQASALFVANTVLYLVLVLPVVMWLFR